MLAQVRTKTRPRKFADFRFFLFLETAQLKSQSSIEEPLLNLNNNQQTSSNTTMFTGKPGRIGKRRATDDPSFTVVRSIAR